METVSGPMEICDKDVDEDKLNWAKEQVQRLATEKELADVKQKMKKMEKDLADATKRELSVYHRYAAGQNDLAEKNKEIKEIKSIKKEAENKLKEKTEELAITKDILDTVRKCVNNEPKKRAVAEEPRVESSVHVAKRSKYSTPPSKDKNPGPPTNDFETGSEVSVWDPTELHLKSGKVLSSKKANVQVEFEYIMDKSGKKLIKHVSKSFCYAHDMTTGSHVGDKSWDVGSIVEVKRKEHDGVWNPAKIVKGAETTDIRTTYKVHFLHNTPEHGQMKLKVNEKNIRERVMDEPFRKPMGRNPRNKLTNEPMEWNGMVGQWQC